jgi:hypothetical protein
MGTQYRAAIHGSPEERRGTSRATIDNFAGISWWGSPQGINSSQEARSWKKNFTNILLTDIYKIKSCCVQKFGIILISVVVVFVTPWAT